MSRSTPSPRHRSTIRDVVVRTSPVKMMSVRTTPISPVVTSPQWRPARNPGTNPYARIGATDGTLSSPGVMCFCSTNSVS